MWEKVDLKCTPNDVIKMKSRIQIKVDTTLMKIKNKGVDEVDGSGMKHKVKDVIKNYENMWNVVDYIDRGAPVSCAFLLNKNMEHIMDLEGYPPICTVPTINVNVPYGIEGLLAFTLYGKPIMMFPINKGMLTCGTWNREFDLGKNMSVLIDALEYTV